MSNRGKSISRQHNIMNTVVTVEVPRHSDHSTVEISNMIEGAFGEFDRVVRQYSRFDDKSELSELNRHPEEHWEVNPEFADLIHYMLEMAHKSDGAFDPTIIDILETYGYDPKYNFSKLDDTELENKIMELVRTRPSWRDIEFNREGRTVKLRPNQRLELGGVGKGYAIDLAYEKLKELPSFFINAGGDIRVKGLSHENGEWRIGLEHKDGDLQKTIGYIQGSDVALACSGSWARRVKNFHHLLNPSTGKPVEELVTVYVAAPTALLADSWATTLFIGGEPMFEKLPEGVEAMLVNNKNQASLTKNFPYRN